MDPKYGQYVKRGTNCIYDVIRNAEDKERTYAEDEPWHNVGRPPLMNDADVGKYSKLLKSNMGEKNVDDKVNMMLLDNMKSKGYVPPSDKKYCTTTLNNYTALFARREGISISDNCIDKTPNRWIAERSDIGVMALIIVIASTHFYVVPQEDPKFRQFVDNECDDETRMLYDMVRNFHGGKPIAVRERHNFINCDDQTFFFCKGLRPGKSTSANWGLVATSCLRSSGTNSIHQVDRSNKMNGLRCKRHLLINGNGDCAPPVYCFCGLTEKEMPNKSFIVMRVEGLCVGGYAAGYSVGVGYVLFMRNFKGAEKLRFKWIRDYILLDFVRWSRMEHGNFDSTSDWKPRWASLKEDEEYEISEPSSGIPLEEEDQIVYYADGDTSQNLTITSDEGIELYGRHGITACKHNAGGTAKEQACDKSKVFTITNQLNKSTTVENVPSCEHRLKSALERAFLKHKDDLIHKKKDAMIDMLAKQPAILTRSQVPKNVVHGMVENGMLDAKHKRMPVLSKIISCNKRVPTREVSELYIKAFNPLMHFSYDNGMRYIPDPVYIEQGFTLDRDMHDQTKMKVAGISKENEQRAKILTAPAEVAERARRAELLELELKRKADDKEAKANAKVAADQDMVDKLCAAANVESSEDNVANCTLKQLSSFTAPQLRSWVLARHPKFRTTKDISHLKKPNGKQALVAAERGDADSLVLVAFNVRHHKSRLLAAPIEEDVGDTPAPDTPDISPYYIDVHLYPNAIKIHPSTILSDSSKVDILVKIFDPEDRWCRVNLSVLSDDAKAELFKKADTLHALLLSRLRHHITQRVDPSQHSNKCLPWAAKNFAIVAAYMILFDHVMKRVSNQDVARCLLRNPENITNFLPCANDNVTKYGCYLHFDPTIESYIRSGSAAGEGGIDKRLKEHEKMAMKPRNDDNSRLYGNYPSKNSERYRVGGNQYEDLSLYIGACFGVDIMSSGVLSKDYHDNGGLFLYKKEELEWINRLHFSGRSGEQKYVQMVAYLFELGYDLAIGRFNNISDSPGFEGCGLMFKK